MVTIASIMDYGESYDRLVLFVNGKKYRVEEPEATVSLAAFLRTKLHLTGTKVACNEGGCGACTVMISEYVRSQSKLRHYSVNSCLMPLCHVHGKAVTTVEGVSTSESAMHAIQKAMCEQGASQCGYCTPGFIMAMYSLLRNNPAPGKEDIDQALQGNLCRCTGYRSILDACYSLQSDNRTGCDVEDCTNGLEARRSEDATPSFPAELILTKYDMEYLKFKGKRCAWYRPTSLTQLLKLKQQNPTAKLVAGNTEIGIDVRFRRMHFADLIYVGDLDELKQCRVDEHKGVYVGAAVRISELEEHVRLIVDRIPAYKSAVLREVLKMIHWFAGKHIRNVATLVGNIVNASPASDITPVLIASRAVLLISSMSRGARERLVDDSFFTAYRKVDLAEDEVVLGVWLTFSRKKQYFKAIKQSQRREDDITIVTVAGSVQFDHGGTTIADIRLAFSGMAPMVKSACRLRSALVGRQWSQDVVEILLDTVSRQFQLKPGTPGGMEPYRMTLQLSLIFKFCLWVTGQLQGKLDRADENPSRAPVQSTHIYDQNMDRLKLHQDTVGRPIAHQSIKLQVTGEAKYCDDLHIYNALHMYFVLSQKAHATLVSVDAGQALSMQGVVAYFGINDVPDGWSNGIGHHNDQLMFADQTVNFFGQVIGIVVATDADTARQASLMVNVTYAELPTILTIEEALREKSFLGDECVLESDWRDDWLSADGDCQALIGGQVRMGGQEHFYFETNACIAIPGEDDEMEVISSTQNPTDAQVAVARMLNVAQHKVKVRVKRIGGGFGGKETATTLVTLPTAFAAKKLGQPVRCCLERYDDMIMMGTRHPFLSRYQCAYDAQGRLRAYHVDHFSNCGSSIDLSIGVIHRALFHSENVYKVEHFRSRGTMCKTNFQSCTAFRGFGAPQGMFAIENCLTDVAHELGMAPESVRECNFYGENDVTPWGQVLNKCNVRRCWRECKSLSDFANRRQLVDRWNSGAAFKKRGIAMVPTKFGIAFGVRVLNQAGALVHIYRDGSVLVSHSGVEMGQGLHTKMIQIASRVLRVPVERIIVKETSTDAVPNTSPTAASFSSDLNGMAVKQACETLMERLKPLIQRYRDATWEALICNAYTERISLSATGFYAPDITSYDWKTKYGPSTYSYFTYGVACTEVEIDCLTGGHVVLRTDIVMDTGASLNPAIDIGQIEGAFVQGCGLFTIEELRVSPNGTVYTRGPGTYKIPSANDIPREFNVQLLKGSTNDNGIFSSKAVGEPPLFLGSSVFFAIKQALWAARRDRNLHGAFRLDSPATCERIRMVCGQHPNIDETLWNERMGGQRWTVEL